MDPRRCQPDWVAVPVRANALNTKEQEMDTIQAVWFAVLFSAIVIWFALAGRLFRLLREDHKDVYEAIGSPSLVLNNSMKNNWLSLRFLVGGSYRELADERVTRLCSVMRVFLVAYLLWFIAPIAWIWILR